MSPVEVVRTGLRELAVNKLRTLLTTLGIVFGVGAVIAMVSIAQGARHEAVKQIEQLGTNSVRIHAVTLTGQDLARARQQGVHGLDLADVSAVARLPLVEAAVPLIVLDAPVGREHRTAAARVVGTWPSYPAVVSFSVARGRFLTALDDERRGTVAVLGAAVAQELLPFRDPVGQVVTVGGLGYRVVGVMEDRRSASSGTSALSSADLGRDVYVPASTVRARYRIDPLAAPVAEIAVRVREGEDIRLAGQLVDDLLMRRHAGVGDFEVVVPEELLRQSQRSQRIFNVVMGAIASISLVVGGIGIMNVMLVTVIQRTREIGIRRAVGATGKAILNQFLAEALVIAVLGGLAGVLLGVTLAGLIASYAGWVTIVSAKAIAVALVVAGTTGVAFGLWPAIKASRVDPMECLRHE